MRAKLGSWWKKLRKSWAVITVIAFLVGVLLLLILIGYRLIWTGFFRKTLWDWMQLLFIPVALAVAGFWFNHRERKAVEKRAEIEQIAAVRRAESEREIEQQRAKSDRDIAEDNQYEAALQEFINKMSELLLVNDLRKSTEDAEVRKIARVRTLTILRGLDPLRKASVLQFLYDSRLIDKDSRIIYLSHADLSGADLNGADLSGVDLSGS